MRCIHMIKKDLGDLIKTERIKQGLSQSTLAERAKISLRTLSDIENYKGNPNLETLYLLANNLNLSLDSIFLKNDDENDPFILQIAREVSKCNPKNRETIYHTVQVLVADLNKSEEEKEEEGQAN